MSQWRRSGPLSPAERRAQKTIEDALKRVPPGSATTDASLLTSGTLATARLPVVPFTKGGTGLSALGTANQVLATNAGVTAVEWQTSAGSVGPATAAVLGTVKISGTPTDAANPVTYVKEQSDTLLAAKAATATTISTTAPLTGGGDLSANRTLAVSAATTIAVGVVELATSGENAANVVVQGNDARLSDSRAPTAHQHVPGDVTGDISATRKFLTSVGTGAAEQDPTWTVLVTGDIATHTHAQADVTSLVADLATKVVVGGQIGGTAASPTILGLRETVGPTLLTTGAVADGEYLRRSGVTLIGGTPAGTGVPTTRTITTTAPLTGGGDLSANRTFAVSAASETAVGVVELATSAETTAGLVVQASDTRLSNARTPTAHQHVPGDVTGDISATRKFLTSVGTGAAEQDPTWTVLVGGDIAAHATNHAQGGTDLLNVEGLVGLLATSQTPAAHSAALITTGTLAFARGGTGLGALGTANQVLATNAGVTAMEWQTPGAASVDIKVATINFGVTGLMQRYRIFTVTDAGVSAASQINLLPGSSTPSGQPASATDEWIMDPAEFAVVPAAGSFQLTVEHRFPNVMVGTRNINYLIG